MITTGGGFKKLEESDYVSAAFYDENSAFNLNVSKTEQELAAKLGKSGGTLTGDIKLASGTAVKGIAGGNERDMLLMDAQGNTNVGGSTGKVRLNGNGAEVVEGGTVYRIWTGKNLTVSATAPASPSEGDIWVDIS